MNLNQEQVWAGTEASLKASLDASETIATRLAAGDYANAEEENDDEPRLLECTDNGVAVISIRGSLNNEDSPWNEIFGMTGYPEIRTAMLAAAQDPSVKQILLDIDSGGGAVSGCEDTGKLIRLIHDNVKPVTAYTDGMMASAAYWLGCSAGSVYCTKTSVVGSIGVITTHMERSKMLEDNGIGVTVVRGGKYKCLANSVEKLTPEGKAQIQQVVDAAYDVFTDYVANARGKSKEYTINSMAEGREFVGQACVDVGLSDGITTFDSLLSDLTAQSLDSSKNTMDNRAKNSIRLLGESSHNSSEEQCMAKKALTAQDITALAAGINIDAQAEAVVETDNVAATTEHPVDAQAEQGIGASATTENSDISDSGVQLLKMQLKEKDDALLEARVTLSKMQDTLAQAEASVAPLVAIAAKSINSMSIALERGDFKAEGMTPVQIAAEHSRVSEAFLSKYKAGGVAAVTSNESDTPAPQVDPAYLARVHAVRAK